MRVGPERWGMIILMKRTLAALAAVLILAGCSNGSPSPGESPSTGAPPAMSPAPTGGPSEPAGKTPKEASELVIGYGALGSVTVGTSKDDAVSTGLFDADKPAPAEGCPSPPLTWKEPFNKVVDVLTNQSGTITSLGVFGKGPKTDEGIGIGSTLGDLNTAYGDKLSGPSEAGYGQSGAYVEDDGDWIGFLFNAAPAAAKATTPITFIEVSKGNKPDLMRDGC